MSDKNQMTTPGEGGSKVNEVTRIAAGAQILGGLLVSSGDIRIDGRFDGTLRTTGSLVIGEQALVTGEVFATNASIRGEMKGTISVSEVLTLMSSSRFSGTLQTVRLSIEKDASIDGNCRIITEEEFNSLLDESQKKGAWPSLF